MSDHQPPAMSEEEAKAAFDARRAADEAAAQLQRERAATANISSQPGPEETPLDDTIQLNPQPQAEIAAPEPEEKPEPTRLPPTPEAKKLVEDFDRAMNVTVQGTRAKERLTAIPEDAEFLSRDAARAKAKERREAGVTIWLDATGSKATIRDLPFADYTMLTGIPAELRRQIDATIKDEGVQEMAKTGKANVRGLDDAAVMMERAEQMANAVCMAAFIKPRLVMREAELDPNDQMLWLVTDIDIDDRLAVLNFINRNREADNAANGGAAIVSGFPGAGVGSPTDSAASNAVPQAT